MGRAARAAWSSLATARDFVVAVATHAKTATRIGMHASWTKPPEFVELLVGRSRRGLFAAPDGLYWIGYVYLEPGSEWLLRIPECACWYTAVNVASQGRQAFWEKARAEGAAVCEPVDLLLSSSGDSDLDTSGYCGFVQIMVRHYFSERVGANHGGEAPTLERIGAEKQTFRMQQVLPALIPVATRFLRARFRLMFLNRRLFRDPRVSRNAFLAPSIGDVGCGAFRYYKCVVDLNPGEWLQVRYHPRGAPYCTFSLANSYCQLIRDESGPQFLTSMQVGRDPQGYIEFLVGESDPRIGDKPILLTHGYRRSWLQFRELLSTSDDDVPELRIIGIEEIGLRRTSSIGETSRQPLDPVPG